jgi:hypothetical protein
VTPVKDTERMSLRGPSRIVNTTRASPGSRRGSIR